jgi:hypothetical protein
MHTATIGHLKIELSKLKFLCQVRILDAPGNMIFPPTIHVSVKTNQIITPEKTRMIMSVIQQCIPRECHVDLVISPTWVSKLKQFVFKYTRRFINHGTK